MELEDKDKDKPLSFQLDGVKLDLRKGKAVFKELRIPVERHPETVKGQVGGSRKLVDHVSNLPLRPLAKELDAVLFATPFDLKTGFVFQLIWHNAKDVEAQVDLETLIVKIADRKKYELSKDPKYKNIDIHHWDVKNKKLLGQLRPFFEKRLEARALAREWMLANAPITQEEITEATDAGTEPVEPKPKASTTASVPKTPSKKKEKEKEKEKAIDKKIDLPLALCDSTNAPFHSRFLPFYIKQDVVVAQHNIFHEFPATTSLFEVDSPFEQTVEDFKQFCVLGRKRKRPSSDDHGAAKKSKFGEKPVIRRWKYLKFLEDYRPPYFGTISKTSKRISPRNPSKKDSEVVNYDVDSEAEWEEEEPGEELMSADEEEPGEEEDPSEMGDFVVDDPALGDSVDGAKKRKQMASSKPVVVKLWESEADRQFLAQFRREWITGLREQADILNLLDIEVIDPFAKDTSLADTTCLSVFKSHQDVVDFLKLVDSFTGTKKELIDGVKEKFDYLPKTAIESNLKQVATREVAPFHDNLASGKRPWRVKEDFFIYLKDEPHAPQPGIVKFVWMRLSRKVFPASADSSTGDDGDGDGQAPLLLAESSQENDAVANGIEVAPGNSVDELPVYTWGTPPMRQRTKMSYRDDTLSHLRVYVATWNMNGKIPSKSIQPFPELPQDVASGAGYHVIAIGTQECYRIDALIHPPVYLWHLRLAHMLGVHSFKVATGTGRILRNKGAVIVGFRLGDMKLVFVNSHLSAHHGKVDARNRNQETILAELKNRGVELDEGGKHLCSVFWFGDLNYRINGNRTLVETLILQNRFEVLRHNDQLYLEMKKGTAFSGFLEGPLTFAPTYKFDIGSTTWPPQYDSSKKSRIPSWTDRILVRLVLPRQDGQQQQLQQRDLMLQQLDVQIEKYGSNFGIGTSDHKPVYGVYRVPLGSSTLKLSRHQSLRSRRSTAVGVGA
ncbi:inositol polyphosphate 5-phosphatase [Phlyctochytrium bullatum]|nr:inositol polyphosphate 5-phosphatase [Phlyctochytrium bullatum]